ncbi:MAG TPA: hypothetical protein VFZ66_21790 [Herpetosiphonaceae bacterium]
MRAPVVLAATHHDPDDSMLAQAQRVLPLLHELYAALVVLATPATASRTIETLRARNVRIEQEQSGERMGLATMGLARQETLRLAAAMHAQHVHLCDWDRLLHWAEQHPDELRDVVDAIPRHDLLILGRTPRAFATHPRVQRDTEAIVNHAFGLAFGQELDVTAAARGLSRRALDLLLALPHPEATVGNDCAWPLHLARVPDLVLGYAATEGLEWETPDRHVDEIAAAGGLDAWIADFDARPENWEFRMRLALHEIEAINRWR